MCVNETNNNKHTGKFQNLLSLTCGRFDKVPFKKNQVIPTDVNRAFVYLLWVQLALNDSMCLLKTQGLLLLFAALMLSRYSVLYADHADLLHVNLCVCAWVRVCACVNE